VPCPRLPPVAGPASPDSDHRPSAAANAVAVTKSCSKGRSIGQIHQLRLGFGIGKEKGQSDNEGGLGLTWDPIGVEVGAFSVASTSPPWSNGDGASVPRVRRLPLPSSARAA
jgi:hypothetical protein